MKNFPIKDEKTGKEYWISRAVAVVTFVFTVIDNKLCILANKRGKGTPDYQGYWNCPCGYLDFDETLQQAAAREVFEETGISIYYPDLKFINCNDDVNEGKQNVTFRFGIVLEDYIPKILEVSERGGEDNEVSEIKWIPVKEISKYKWAFNHEQIIWNILVKNITMSQHY